MLSMRRVKMQKIYHRNKCLNDRGHPQREATCFKELAEIISASLADMSSLSVTPEKCTIIQETVSQIHRIQQQQQAAGGGDELQWSEVSSSNSSILNSEVLGPLLLEALDGFLLVVNTDGKIEVVSENISYFLKYTKDDLAGKSIYNIIHVGDHARFSSNLLPMSIGNGFGWTSEPGSGTNKSRTFNCRFLVKPSEDPEESMEEKQTRISQYESMQLSTVLLPHPSEHSDSPETESSDAQNLLFCVARRIPLNERTQNSCGVEQFTTKLDLTGKILDIDTSGVLLTYSQYLKDLDERIIHKLCHPKDLHKLIQHLKETLQVGSSTSSIYRLRVPNENYIYVQTKSKRVPFNSVTSEQEFIMSTHSIIRDADIPDVNQRKTNSSVSEGSTSSNGVSTGVHTSSTTTATAVSDPSSDSLYSSHTSLNLAPREFSLYDLSLDVFSSSDWEVPTGNNKERVNIDNDIPNPSSSVSGGSNVRMALGKVQHVHVSNSAFTTEMSSVTQSPIVQMTSPGVGQAITLSTYSYSHLQGPPSTPLSVGPRKMENEICVISDAKSNNCNMSSTNFSEHQTSIKTNPKLRNLLTQGSEQTDSLVRANSPFTKLFSDGRNSQNNHSSGSENGLVLKGISVTTGDNGSSSASKNVILRELLNQNEDSVQERPNKSRFSSGGSKTGMPFTNMDNSKSETSQELSKKNINNNNMLRKLLNSEVENDRSSRGSQAMLIQQLLKAESHEKNENSVSVNNVQSSSTDQLFKNAVLSSSSTSNSSFPTSLSNVFGSIFKRKSDDDDESGSNPPSKRPAVQHPRLAGQNPMLASMLAQTPKTEPSVPTTIANSIMSQLPQDRLPKNLEKKLIQTPCVVVTCSCSSSSTHQNTVHVTSTSHSLLHQDVVTADSRGRVTLGHQSATTLNLPSGQITQPPQRGIPPHHHNQGFLSSILNSSDGSRLTAASATVTSSSQLGQNTYSHFQLSNHQVQQPAKTITLSDMLGDVGSFDSVVGLTTQSQTSDPMLSQILDEVWSMQQEMESTPIDDSMIRKILDEVFEQPPGSSASGGLPPNNQTVNTVQDVHEKLAINAIRQQLMSYEISTSSSSSTNTSLSLKSSLHPQTPVALRTPVVRFSSTNSYPSVSVSLSPNGAQPGHRVQLQSPGDVGLQHSVALRNFQRLGGTQHPNSGGGITSNISPEVYYKLLERRQKMLHHQKRLQGQQQVVQSRQPITEPLTPASTPVFTESMTDLFNNTVAPNVTLQHFSGVPEPQLSPRYNVTLLGQTSQSQVSPSQHPGQQCPYSSLSQQSFPSPSPPVSNSYNQQRIPSYPSSPVPVTGVGPLSPLLQVLSPQSQWNQRAAPSTTTTDSVQQQNPILNDQLSQNSLMNQSRFVSQAQRQLQVRSMPSPNSVANQGNSPLPSQTDGQFRPHSPGHLYQQASQAQKKQQRLQRTVSLPGHVNSPRTPQGGFVGGEQVISPQPQISPSYTTQSTRGNNYTSTDNSHFSFDQQSLQIYGSGLVERGPVTGNDPGGVTSEYVRQELRAMVGAKTQQTQNQQFQHYVLSGGSNPDRVGSTTSHQTFNQIDLDTLVLSLDIGTAGDSSPVSPGLFPPPLLGVSGNPGSTPQISSHNTRNETPKPDQKKSLLQQLLQHAPEPC
ncbi:uncharacterized protein LOC143239086 isoform X3 [Tachypleus tridentatus]|uniref:uncharacterized protein LOC143239086 isoform X3 n=1 Tax=Tachypleus tridentatus TaxID=6853 RepID=UPI003FD62E50